MIKVRIFVAVWDPEFDPSTRSNDQCCEEDRTSTSARSVGSSSCVCSLASGARFRGAVLVSVNPLCSVKKKQMWKTKES